jgi:hypothetical protein
MVGIIQHKITKSIIWCYNLEKAHYTRKLENDRIVPASGKREATSKK